MRWYTAWHHGDNSNQQYADESSKRVIGGKFVKGKKYEHQTSVVATKSDGRLRNTNLQPHFNELLLLEKL
jgi:hypothetical protein